MSEDLHDAALRRLLRDAAPLRDFHVEVDEATRGDASSGPAAVESAAPDARLVGRYRIVRELGRGGMGVVYEAEDPELRRRVAIKVLAHAGADPALKARFAREAQAAARLRHPNIAAVYEALDDAIVMQLVDGVPLSKLEPGDPRQAVSLVRDAALAVQHAHEEGVIHRDLKPHNLLVEGGRVVVTDFGLAKEMGGAETLSQSGHILGTPAYMAPEQAQGRVHAVDPRTDVYGLGATLFHLLTGRPPFADGDVARLLARIVDEEPGSIRAHRPELPRDLDKVVRRCLAKDKSQRYASARALADDLGRWLDGRPVLAKPPSVGYRVAKFARRRRAVLVVAGLAVLALVVGLVATVAARARTEARIEALSLSEYVGAAMADAEMYRRGGDSDEVSMVLADAQEACEEFVERHADVPQAWLLLGRVRFARDDGGGAVAAFDRALALDAGLVEARVHRGIARAAQGGAATAAAAGGKSPAEAVIADLEQAEDEPAGLRQVDILVARSELAKLRGDLERARSLAEDAVRLDPIHIGARLTLSRIGLAQNRGDEAWHLAMSTIDIHRGLGQAYLSRASALPERAGEAPGESVEEVSRRHELAAADKSIEEGDRSAEAYQRRAGARLSIADVAGALEDFGEALKAEPGDAFAWGHRGLVQARRAAALAAGGKEAEALEAWEAAIEDCTRALTIEPSLAGAANNRGVFRIERERLLGRLSRWSQAAAELDAALADFDRAIEGEPRFALAMSNRALALRRKGEDALRRQALAEADASFARAAADLDRIVTLAPDDARVRLERAFLHDLRSVILAIRGDFAGADEQRRLARGGWDEARR